MRKQLLSFALVAAAILMWMPGCDDLRYDLQLTMDTAMEAEAKGDWTTYMSVLDPQDIEHYERLIAMARGGTREQISRMPPADRIEIAYMRATMTGAELRKLDAKGLIARGFSMWDPDEGTSNVTLGQIKHRPPRAQAQLIVDGRWTNEWLEFVKIEDKWYFSDRAFDRWFDQRVAARAARTNRSEDYVLLQLLRAITGKHIDDRIWDAPPR